MAIVESNDSKYKVRNDENNVKGIIIKISSGHDDSGSY